MIQIYLDEKTPGDEK